MGKDVNRINAIIRYCDKIEERMDEFGRDIEDFIDNPAYHDLCSFYMSQIGENVSFLSPEITKKYPEISWRGMIELRNSIAHGYDGMDLEIVWSTITKKIPVLKKTCEKILREYRTP